MRVSILVHGAVVLLAGIVSSPRASAQFIALDSPAGLVGNQNFGGSLGMHFNVGLTPVQITRLGAFDSAQDGFTNPINVRLYDRNNVAAPVLSESLSGPAGTLINGSRFVVPGSVLTLPAGFNGAIVADGYSALEPLSNSGISGPTPTINNAGGALKFVGPSFFGTAGAYPTGADLGPANRYNAGTFEFQPVGPVFRIAYDVNPGTNGGQNFGGVLGLDFDVGSSAVSLTHLGVFDSGGDGLNLSINAYVYDRDTLLPVLGPFTFSGTGDQLVNGSRWKDITDFVLPAGFHGTVVAEGYGATELLYNTGGTVPGGASLLDDGAGAISFVGAGRYGLTPGFYPDVVDTGPANRYGAGTFAFTVVPEPATAGIVAFGGGLLLLRRRRAE